MRSRSSIRSLDYTTWTAAVAVVAATLVLALGLLPGAVAAQQAISSSPKDTTEYLRPLTTEDIFPTGVYGFVAPPGIFVVIPW